MFPGSVRTGGVLSAPPARQTGFFACATWRSCPVLSETYGPVTARARTTYPPTTVEHAFHWMTSLAAGASCAIGCVVASRRTSDGDATSVTPMFCNATPPAFV